MEVQDLQGKTISVGDRVAGAFRDSTLAYLRLGTVLGFSERGNKLTVRVQWDTESGARGPHPVDIVGSIDAGLYRFIKLEA